MCYASGMDYSFCVNRSDWIFIGKIEVELHKKKKPKCKTRQNAQQKTELKTKLKPKSKLESTLKSKPKSIKKSCKFEAIKRRLNHCGKSKPRVTLVNNKFAKNPTYKELVEFLDKDRTEETRYSYRKFVCADFAERLHNNAEKHGIKAGLVAVEFTDGRRHACNAFETIDRGLIFVDSTGSITDPEVAHDKTVKVKVGESYKPVPLHSSSWSYYTMGKVKKYKIYW